MYKNKIVYKVNIILILTFVHILNCRHCWGSSSRWGHQLWLKICQLIMMIGLSGITLTITLWSCMIRTPSTAGLQPVFTASHLSSQ